jgi:hypothetical protein
MDQTELAVQKESQRKVVKNSVAVLNFQKKELFTIEPKSSTPGKVTFAWNPEGTLLASGTSKSVSVYDRSGEVVEEIAITGFVTSVNY